MARTDGTARSSLTPLVARAAWGSILLARPTTILQWSSGPVQPPTAVRVLRLLGARHLLQCGSEVLWGRRAVRIGVLVDCAHATSDLAFALIDRRWRRAAMTDSAVTLGFVGLGLDQVGLVDFFDRHVRPVIHLQDA